MTPAGTAPDRESGADGGAGHGDENLGGIVPDGGKTARTPGQGRTDKQPQEKPPGSLGAPAAPPVPGFFHTARHSSPLSLSDRIAPTPFPALRVFCRMGRNSHSRGAGSRIAFPAPARRQPSPLPGEAKSARFGACTPSRRRARWLPSWGGRKARLAAHADFCGGALTGFPCTGTGVRWPCKGVSHDETEGPPFPFGPDRAAVFTHSRVFSQSGVKAPFPLGLDRRAASSLPARREPSPLPGN